MRTSEKPDCRPLGLGVLLLLLAAALPACDTVLDQEPQGFVSSENFYRNEQDARSALNGAYNGLRWIDQGYPVATAVFVSPTSMLTTYSGPNSTRGSFDAWTWTPSNNYLETIWSNAYDAINRTNAVVENIPNVEMDEAEKTRFVAEARFLRAYHYFSLLRLFGGVPLRVEETTGYENAQPVPRTPAGEVYAFVIEELTAVADVLPSRGETGDPGRASAGAARTLLAKVYLQRGSGATPGVEPQSGDFENAVTLLEEVRASGEYSLLPDYAGLFYESNENNVETIFSLEHTRQEGQGTGDQDFLAPAGTNWGRGQWTSFGGELPFFQSYQEDEGDVRREASWVTEYEDPSTGALRAWNPDDLENDGFTNDGPAPQKLIYDIPDLGYLEGPRDYLLLRYADVLLNLAEALNEVNAGPTTEAYEAVNAVRTRAGLPGLQQGLGYDQFKDALFQELRWEFTQELRGIHIGRRFWERFVEAVESSADQADPSRRTHPVVDFEVEDYQRLYPIPQGAIDRNGELEQNPGY